MSDDDMTPEDIREERERIVAEIKKTHDQLSELYSELDTLQQKCGHTDLTELVVFGQPVKICPDCSWQEQDG